MDQSPLGSFLLEPLKCSGPFGACIFFPADVVVDVDAWVLILLGAVVQCIVCFMVFVSGVVVLPLGLTYIPSPSLGSLASLGC